MTIPGPTLINSQPLRINVQQSHSKTASELEEETFSTYPNSSGIVISYKDGVGETLLILFKDVGLHFVFTKSTCFQYPYDHDPIGVGSVVQVFWSRSFERCVAGSHIVVQIEKMEVYRCANMLEDQIFVTYNSHSAPGVAIGVTERSTTVAFHPSCSPRSRHETLKTLKEGSTEFRMRNKHHENTNRMVEVVLAAVPFRVEIRGNVDKIPYIVLRKRGYTPGKDGVAVITTILKHHFMEAYFLESSERVYFDSKSCHSNILDKVTVGSLINVMASPAFHSSCYKWYGYDVTVCDKYEPNSQAQRNFGMKNNEILQTGKEKEEASLKTAKSVFQRNMNLYAEVADEEDAKKKVKQPMNLYELDSKSAQYKLRHILLDACFSNLDPRSARMTYDSFFMDRLMDNSKIKFNEFGNIEHRRRYLSDSDEEEDVEENGVQRANYSESMQNGIREVLEPFGLNRPRVSSQPSTSKQEESKEVLLAKSSYSDERMLHNEKKKKKKPWEESNKLTSEDVRERIGSLMDSEGFALNQKVQDQFVIPDTRWKPKERRWIGLHDDLQWTMMATFGPIREEQNEDAPLLGGWWYRRSVPRIHPVGIVERMETRRNVIEDCTVSMMIEMSQTMKIFKQPGPSNTSTASTSSKPEDAVPHQNPLFTQVTADMLGITNLDTPAAELLEFLARETLKETLRLAKIWTHKNSRHRMTVTDVENVIRYMQNTGHLNIHSVDTLNLGIQNLAPVPGTSTGLYSFQKTSSDVDVDKEDSETFVKIPRELRLISYPLVTDGQPVQSEYSVNADEEEGAYFEKNTPEVMAPIQEKSETTRAKTCLQMFRDAVKSAKIDQKVGLKPATAEILTVEQQIFMKDIITVCMGQDDKKRHEALYTLETDAGLQVFLPHLTERICKSISANISQRCLSLIIYAGRVLRSLSHNKACDMTVTLHHVLPALLSCCVGRNMCLRPETDNHWALRDFSAKTLVGLVREQVDKSDNGFTARRLFDFSYRIFKNPSSSFSMIYGTIHILQEFVVDAKKAAWLLTEFQEMSGRCKQHIDSATRMGTPQLSVQEAAKLSQQILKAETNIRSRYSIPIASGGTALNRRYL
uniref:Transcription initiation factor TFIID subunit 6 n=1 Tax=Caenorhabditis tropicalis TaxID=1561998 RepID=A0A1I7TGA9_9PELO